MQLDKSLKLMSEVMSGTNIHVTNVSPNVVNSELLETTIDPVLKEGLDEF